MTGCGAAIHRWPEVAKIFDQAIELPAGERSAFVATAAGGDAVLAAEVEALLAAAVAAGAFLETPIGVVAAELLTEPGDDGGAGLEGGRLGPYELTRWIGGGGMGDVYEALDHRLRRRVAVKLLPAAWSRDARAKKRFVREARAAAAVDHPNICNLHDAGETDEGQLYLVMAYYQGDTLAEKVARGPLPISEAREVAVQVARGLEAAHDSLIIHRDIKPSNVMITDRGEARILDFGIARIAGATHITPSGRSPGTPAYMSPEQVTNSAVDRRTDVWSLGVVLYEMLAGRRPFEGENRTAVTHAIVEHDPEPLEALRPEIPGYLARIVTRALAKEPGDRYRSVREVRADLEMGTAPRWPAAPGRASSATKYATSPRRRRAISGFGPEDRLEYRDNELLAMYEASPAHNTICWNLTGILHSQLGSSGCCGFVHQMRVRVPAPYRYVYPDVVIACGGPVFEAHDVHVLTNPTLVIEVLSPATEEQDRGIKLFGYRSLPSLSACLLVAQDRVWVEHWTRQEDGRWLVAEMNDLAAALDLPQIGCTLPLGAIYAGLKIGS